MRLLGIEVDEMTRLEAASWLLERQVEVEWTAIAASARIRIKPIEPAELAAQQRTTTAATTRSAR